MMVWGRVAINPETTNITTAVYKDHMIGKILYRFLAHTGSSCFHLLILCFPIIGIPIEGRTQTGLYINYLVASTN